MCVTISNLGLYEHVIFIAGLIACAVCFPWALLSSVGVREKIEHCSLSFSAADILNREQPECCNSPDGSDVGTQDSCRYLPPIPIFETCRCRRFVGLMSTRVKIGFYSTNIVYIPPHRIVCTMCAKACIDYGTSNQSLMRSRLSSFLPSSFTSHSELDGLVDEIYSVINIQRLSGSRECSIKC